MRATRAATGNNHTASPPTLPGERTTTFPYVFLGSIAAASLVAHKYWPKGFPHGEKEEWELSDLALHARNRRQAEKDSKGCGGAYEGRDDQNQHTSAVTGRSASLNGGCCCCLYDRNWRHEKLTYCFRNSKSKSARPRPILPGTSRRIGGDIQALTTVGYVQEPSYIKQNLRERTIMTRGRVSFGSDGYRYLQGSSLSPSKQVLNNQEDTTSRTFDVCHGTYN